MQAERVVLVKSVAKHGGEEEEANWKLSEARQQLWLLLDLAVRSHWSSLDRPFFSFLVQLSLENAGSKL